MGEPQKSPFPESVLHRLRRNCPPGLRWSELGRIDPVTEFQGPGLYVLKGSPSAGGALLARAEEPDGCTILCTIYRDEGGGVGVPMSRASFNAIVLGAIAAKVSPIAAE